MAERFLEEIYSKAIIIQELREYIEHVNGGRPRDARHVYNLAAKGLENLLPELEEVNPNLAGSIFEVAVKIRDNYEDVSRATALVEGKMIPALFNYMQDFTGIDVTEGKYSLYSAQSGFLTIRDLKLGITLHSEYDPLWEAEKISESIYDPAFETYHILGVGLGYLPYQLWRQSEGAVQIVVYEEDEEILDYARKYGVLNWIKEDSLNIICEKDKEKLGRFFLQNLDDDDIGVYISTWKTGLYKAVDNGKIHILEANTALERSMRRRTKVNLRKNRKHLQIGFKTIRERFDYTEWIIVSAGPSMDEQVSFLKMCKGKCGIVAVNTVMRRLFKEGIQPDIFVAADQYVQMREHIDGIGDQTEGIPMIAEKRTNWQFVEQYRGPICFVSAGEIDGNETWGVSGSVAGLALETAVRLGAKTIYLVGQDLAYPEGKTYATGMPYVADAKSRGTKLVPAVDGSMVPTSDAFDWFRQGLESSIKKYPDVKFINMSKHGALIQGCENSQN